jgi:glycosyltransferase involved in cell wall biosynthesis
MQEALTEWSNSLRLVKDPLVSVLMVTYNHESYLAKAIESVVRQETSFPIELIIGEDCSTDGTREVALAYQKRFPEMSRVITSEHNVGAHSNVARVIAAARGKYIAFCEGDDFWHRSDKLQRQIPVFQGDPSVVLVCSSWRVMTPEGALVEEDALASRHFPRNEISASDVWVVKTLTVCAQRSYVQKALHESPLCKNHTYPFGDAPLWVELTRYGRCCYLPEVLGTYVLSENSAMRRTDPLHYYWFVSSCLGFLNDALDLYPLAQGEGATRAAKIEATCSRLRTCAILGDFTTARAQLSRLKSLKVTPTPRDKLLLCAAHIPLPRAALLPAMKKSLELWRLVRRSMRG